MEVRRRMPSDHAYVLQIDLYTEVEASVAWEQTSVDALVEYAIAARELRVLACVLGEGDEVICLSPYGQALKP